MIRVKNFGKFSLVVFAIIIISLNYVIVYAEQSTEQQCGLTATRGSVTICMGPSFTSYFSWDQAFLKYDLDHKNSIKQDIIAIIFDFNGKGWTGIECGYCFDVKSHLFAPYWFWNDLKWWTTSQISDNEFSSAIQYLYNQDLLGFSVGDTELSFFP